MAKEFELKLTTEQVIEILIQTLQLISEDYGLVAETQRMIASDILEHISKNSDIDIEKGKE